MFSSLPKDPSVKTITGQKVQLQKTLVANHLHTLLIGETDLPISSVPREVEKHKIGKCSKWIITGTSRFFADSKSPTPSTRE